MRKVVGTGRRMKFKRKLIVCLQMSKLKIVRQPAETGRRMNIGVADSGSGVFFKTNLLGLKILKFFDADPDPGS